MNKECFQYGFADTIKDLKMKTYADNILRDNTLKLRMTRVEIGIEEHYFKNGLKMF